MNYDQLISQINDLGEGDRDLGCIRYFQQRGILHQERICCKCGNEMRISTARGNYVWRCKFKRCKATKGLRTNTWFNNGNQGSKLPFLTIFKFIYWWSIESHSIKFCHRELKMASDTTVHFCSYMREVCSNIINFRRRSVIGGINLTVEVLLFNFYD
ncbi:unnamed protein product [Meloidogyne enterolobii]|uniref:Uncharacterized protein n=1 Tax=Meloidogyne enterolobii TaxID=390850 RepID=A0ACB1B6L5_MELEN